MGKCATITYFYWFGECGVDKGESHIAALPSLNHILHLGLFPSGRRQDQNSVQFSLMATVALPSKAFAALRTIDRAGEATRSVFATGNAGQPFFTHLEPGKQCVQRRNFLGKAMAGRRLFFRHSGGVLLGFLIHGIDGDVDLLETGGLTLRALDDGRHVTVDRLHLDHDLLQRPAGITDEIDSFLNLLVRSESGLNGR